MAYVLMGELFFIEEIWLSGMLPTTKPYQGLLRSRMAYMLMGELFFIEEIRLSGMLPTTKPYQELLRGRMTYVLKGELFFIEETRLSGKLPRPIEGQNDICAEGRAVLHRGNTAIRQATKTY